MDKKPNKTKRFVVTIKVTSELGTKPYVRTVCGDTIICSLDDGQSASWTIKRITKRPKSKRMT